MPTKVTDISSRRLPFEELPVPPGAMYRPDMIALAALYHGVVMDDEVSRRRLLSSLMEARHNHTRVWLPHTLAGLADVTIDQDKMLQLYQALSAAPGE